MTRPMLFTLILLIPYLTRAAAPATQPFLHPGLLHTAADFSRIRTKLAAHAEPWTSAYAKLAANPHASLKWNPRPAEVIYRGKNPTHPENYPQLYNDIAAAYACALRYRISNDPAYADKAVQIMNAWSGTLKRLDGSADRFLAAGIYGYEFANAAELLRDSPAWSREDFRRFQSMMLTVFAAPNEDFLTRHNGAKIDHYWANWDACNMASLLAIGVLCDRRDLYDHAVTYYKHGDGNGSIQHAVPFLHEGHLGQWQESGRDQGHSTLGIALLGSLCQMAFNQGDDLFAYDDNRFLAGAEYVAKYNLGQDVPYTPYHNSDVRQDHISDAARGNPRPCWELVFNHYARLEHLRAPYSQMMAEKLRPEGGGGNYGPNSGGYDQLGYGTLMFTLDP